jgi:hypothetical protein
MNRTMLLLCALCLTLCGTLFAVSRSAAESSWAAYADAARNATSCELTSCGCLGMRCSCFECGGGNSDSTKTK